MSKKNSSEDLTQMHRDARKRKRRRHIILAACISAAAIVIIVAAVILLQKKVSSTYASSDSGGVESAEVTSGSISESISGSGTLTSEDVESITVPSAVEIDTFYVEEGDSVEEGDLIATVTSSSLLSAMSSVQSEIDTLDEEIEAASDDEVSSTITAGTAGRVKKIYAEEDTSVVTTMYSSGALILLSLDGYMAVDIETDSLSKDDTVTITDSDGTEYTGTVESVSDGVATILVTDDGTEYEDTVTVTDPDGTEVGTGTLYIHSQYSVTGYAGTVSSISVSENESVSSGDTLITLTDTETSANYDALLKERETLEETLESLIKIYKEGGVCATAAGVVETLYDTTSASSSDAMSASGSTSSSETTVADISAESTMTVTISVDESDILYISEGLEAEVTISSVSDDAFTGTVSEISTTATSDSGVTTYSATVTIDKTDDMLSGMSASVVIIIQGVDDALLIPVDALYQTSSTSYVYTEYDEETGELSGMVEVVTGLSNSSYVEITSGLSEGDTVYYASDSDDSSFDLSDITGGMSDFSGMSDFTTGGDSGTGGSSLPSGGGDTSGGDTSGGMPSMGN